MAVRPSAAPEDRRPAAGGSVVFDAVGKVYRSAAGSVEALQDVSFEIPAGSIFGIIGRSGAGKSSLLRTINRLERPSVGRVLVGGEDIAALDEGGLVQLRRRVGMIFQHFNLLSAKTVWGNVALPLIVAGVPREAIERRVADVLGLVGLEGKEQTYPSRLSGGQKQRVGIARALIHRPEILLCDEATSALDPETTVSILRLLRDINRRFGLTIILITHEMSVAREICDQLLVLDGGRIAEAGPTWQIFGNPVHPATKALLRPLERELPADIQARLVSAPDGSGRWSVVVELIYSGEGGLEPDLDRIAGLFGGRARLLQSTLDRVQGHVHGHLVLVGEALSDEDFEAAAPLAHSIRILGYVAGDV